MYSSELIKKLKLVPKYILLRLTLQICGFVKEKPKIFQVFVHFPKNVIRVIYYLLIIVEMKFQRFSKHPTRFQRTL